MSNVDFFEHNPGGPPPPAPPARTSGRPLLTPRQLPVLGLVLAAIAASLGASSRYLTLTMLETNSPISGPTTSGYRYFLEANGHQSLQNIGAQGASLPSGHGPRYGIVLVAIAVLLLISVVLALLRPRWPVLTIAGSALGLGLFITFLMLLLTGSVWTGDPVDALVARSLTFGPAVWLTLVAALLCFATVSMHWTLSRGARTADIRSCVQAELALLQPQVRANAAVVSGLLAADYTEIGASGRFWNRAEIIGAISRDAHQQPSFPVASVIHAAALDADLVHVVYHSDNAGRRALRTSLWRRETGGWRVFFHQGTPTP